MAVKLAISPSNILLAYQGKKMEAGKGERAWSLLGRSRVDMLSQALRRYSKAALSTEPTGTDSFSGSAEQE